MRRSVLHDEGVKVGAGLSCGEVSRMVVAKPIVAKPIVAKPIVAKP